MVKLSGKLKDTRKTKLKINIETHSGIDSFLSNREYNMKGHIINTMDTMKSSAGTSSFAFESPALYLVVIDQMG